MKLGKYMTAEPVGTAGHETWVISGRKGDVLGYVEWCPAWRCYTFVPDGDCIFSHDCLTALAQFCKAPEVIRA